MAAATHFPDSFIRLLPVRFQESHQRYHERPIDFCHFESGTITLPHCGQYLAIHIELKLVRSSVSDTHRPGVLVSGQPWDFVFEETTFAAHAVDRLHLCRAASYGAQKPFSPRLRFLAIAGAE